MKNRYIRNPPVLLQGGIYLEVRQGFMIRLQQPLALAIQDGYAVPCIAAA